MKVNINDGFIDATVIGAGHVSVFIHGFSLNKSMWDSYVSYFSKSFKIISYDLRGFGNSSTPTSAYSHHQDLKELLDELDVTSCTLVGFSLGGAVAIDFALEFPELVEKLVLLSTGLSGFVPRGDFDLSATSVRLEDKKKEWLAHPIFSGTRDDVRHILARFVNDYSGWHWEHDDPRIRLQPSATSRVHEIACPVYIVVGENDMDYFRNVAEHLKTCIKSSTAITMENQGHFIPFEGRKKLTHILYGLLNKVSII